MTDTEATAKALTDLEAAIAALQAVMRAIMDADDGHGARGEPATPPPQGHETAAVRLGPSLYDSPFGPDDPAAKIMARLFPERQPDDPPVAKPRACSWSGCGKVLHAAAGFIEVTHQPTGDLESYCSLECLHWQLHEELR